MRGFSTREDQPEELEEAHQVLVSAGDHLVDKEEETEAGSPEDQRKLWLLPSAKRL